MHRKYFYLIGVLTLLSILFIVYTFQEEKRLPAQPEHIIEPPRSPYKSYISAVGVVEPSSGNISIGTPVNRIVEKVYVKVGEKVKKGDVLFQLENRDLKADLRVQEMAYKSALAKMQKLEALPHPDDLASSEASLRAVQAELDEAKYKYDRVLDLPDPRAISQEEKDRRKYSYLQAQQKFNEAQSQFDKVHKGTWKPDLEIAHFEALHAKANVAAIETEIQRTTIRSPINGTVLQIKVHEGEFSQGDFRLPIMILGDISELYLRVSINQLEVPYFNPKSPAVAYLQGDAHLVFPLEFVRVEPLLVAKEDVTNEVNEKVDTRIFQVIYKIQKSDFHLFGGARMDVFIEREAVG